MSLTLKEKPILTVFENRALRRIFVYYRDGVTGQWRKLHSEELSDLYISQNIFRMMEIRRKNWERHDTIGERRLL